MLPGKDVDGTIGVFLDTLEGFAAGGLRAGDSVIVIATALHRERLEDLLKLRGIDVDEAQRTNQYIPLDADEVLALHGQRLAR